MEKVFLNSYTICTFFDERERCKFSRSGTIIYCTMDEQTAVQVWDQMEQKDIVLAAISGIDWNRDLSPWPAKAAFGNEPFSGGAKHYLNNLTKDICKTVEQDTKIIPDKRGIAGYSLAGLFAVWSLYNTDFFDGAASMSGSLWFDGFCDFTRTNEFCKMPDGIYLSLGTREAKTKNQRMAQVESCTQNYLSRLRETGVPVTYERNPGGHFFDIPQRIAKGIDWLAKKWR